MPTFIDEAVTVIRNLGSMFAAKNDGDTLWRWRVVAESGVIQWGDGQSASRGALGIINTQYGRTLLEINPMAGQFGGP